MPNFINNVGLECIWDDEETRRNFLGYLTQEGRAITGYFGYPTFSNDMGSIDLFVKTQMNDKGNLEVAGLDTHCSGPEFWQLRNAGINIMPSDSLPTERIFMFKNHKDGSGLIPIHLVNADVLPSFFEDDVVKAQMCAFPVEINYYADEDAYADAQPETKDGKKWLLEDGSLFPAAFLGNHTPENNDKDCSTDDLVLFRGTVKRVGSGAFELGEETDYTYVRCVIDTQYGELILAHTIDQVEPEQLDNIKVGAVVFGVCVLSGDVAILEYHDGIVRDFEHNLRLLRHVIVNGQAERLQPVLCEDAIYISDSPNRKYTGINDIIERFNRVHNNQSDKCFATPATITQADGEDLEYGVGTRCLLISYKTEGKYDAIVFIDVTDSGMIERIYFTEDTRYHFEVDQKPKDKSFLDDIKLPESCVDLICNRAKFYGMTDDIDSDELFNGTSSLSTWKNNAERMIAALSDNKQPDIEKAFENIFGYLFAKSIEMTYNEEQAQSGYNFIASYSPEDAFGGVISTTLPEDKHLKIVSALEKGKTFYKDFEHFITALELTDDDFVDELADALVIVQCIGEKYAPKYLKQDSKGESI